jgi:hypothetical protein
MITTLQTFTTDIQLTRVNDLEHDYEIHLEFENKEYFFVINKDLLESEDTEKQLRNAYADCITALKDPDNAEPTLTRLYDLDVFRVETYNGWDEYEPNIEHLLYAIVKLNIILSKM